MLFVLFQQTIYSYSAIPCCLDVILLAWFEKWCPSTFVWCSFLIYFHKLKLAVNFKCCLIVDLVRTLLPNTIPPSYRGTTIRYLYYCRTMLSGQFLILENEHSLGESVQEFSELVSCYCLVLCFSGNQGISCFSCNCINSCSFLLAVSINAPAYHQSLDLELVQVYAMQFLYNATSDILTSMIQLKMNSFTLTHTAQIENTEFR